MSKLAKPTNMLNGKILYKAVSKEGTSIFADHQYKLPKGGKPGAWESVKLPLIKCSNGFHVTTRPFSWMDGLSDRVFEVEVKGQCIGKESDKLVVESMRLMREIKGQELLLLAVEQLDNRNAMDLVKKNWNKFDAITKFLISKHSVDGFSIAIDKADKDPETANILRTKLVRRTADYGNTWHCSKISNECRDLYRNSRKDTNRDQ